MSEMTSVEQQQQQQQQPYVSGSSNHEHHCKDCGLYFESDKSLEVHLRYHQENLLSQWASQAQQEESNNNNSKAGNHNSGVSSHGVTKRESVTAPADSSESSSRPPSEGSAPSQQQQSNSLQRGQQQPPSSGVQNYGGHFQTPMFSETSYFMQNEPSYILPHEYSPGHEEASNNGNSSNYTRYHPYQHQQHFPAERANSVSSTSPRSPPLQCDKCGSVFEDAMQLGEHVRVNHTTSPGSYTGQTQYQQLGGSPQQQQQQQQSQQQQQMHTSPSQNSQPGGQGQQQQSGYDYNGGRASIKTEVKQEPEEQAEILDLDSHKVQTHRYEEELMRIHQQEMHNMQLQQQQHVLPHQQQAQQQQQQQQPPRGGPHSVSSMLGWPPAQPHEYHPGLSPMGPMDSVSPVPDQSQFMRGQHMPVEPPRHPGSPIITSTQPMPNHQMPTGMLQQPQKASAIGNQSWKSNEARRPKTYNCTACNKWFTSSGHLKRHYNTTLHKNAVKQSNMPDPANMPISAHHHPGRDPNVTHGSRGGGASRSPELSTSGSPPNLMAGPSGEAARGLLNTPTNLYTTSNSSNGSNSNSSDSSPVVLAPQQQQQAQAPPSASTVHMGSTMVGLNTVPSPMGSHPQHHPHHHHHHQQMGSPSPQLVQHPLSIGSPSQLVVHHPMSSPMQPPPPPQHLSSPSAMGSHHHHLPLHNQHHSSHHHQQSGHHHHHHHTNSSLNIMGGVPSMVSPPMGGTSMPHQPYPNALPPHVTITTSIPALLESITNQLTTIGNEIPEQSHEHNQSQQEHQQSQDLILPGFGTFNNHQRPLPTFTQFGAPFLVGHNQPQAVNVGGLSPGDTNPQTTTFVQPNENYDNYGNSPPRYESLTNMEIVEVDVSSPPNTDGMIIKQYEMQTHHHSDDHDPRNSNPQHETSEEQRQIETNNNVPHRQGKEEINPNIVKKQRQMAREEKKSNGVITKEHQVTSTNTGSHYISHEGFHKCIECNKVFNKACYLTQHNKSFHSGDKPFKCNQCGKRFPLEYLHAEHLQKHAGEKPYKCEICPKQFNHKTDLRRHMCLHTGEKPYACDNCGKGFIRKDHMMKHLETHKKKNNNHHNLHLRA